MKFNLLFFFFNYGLFLRRIRLRLLVLFFGGYDLFDDFNLLSEFEIIIFGDNVFVCKIF